MTEDVYDAIGDYRTSDLYSAAEKVAIEYAERFGADHLSIDDELFARLGEHFDEGEIVELTLITARHLAFGRMTKVLELDQVCALPGMGNDESDRNPVNFH